MQEKEEPQSRIGQTDRPAPLLIGWSSLCKEISNKTNNFWVVIVIVMQNPWVATASLIVVFCQPATKKITNRQIGTERQTNIKTRKKTKTGS